MSPLFPPSRWERQNGTLYPVRVALASGALPGVGKRALDLFCGAGGASVGLHRAGFDVFGIDWTGQPHYPFAMKVERVERISPEFLRAFDLIWASPPCQKFSIATKTGGGTRVHHDLIPMTRDLLEEAAVPFIIENVPQAPLRADLLLCGSMFGLRLVRHRIFETGGFKASQPQHPDHHWQSVTVAGTPGSRGVKPGYGLLSDWSEAMGIDWMPSRALAQAVPPAYSEYLAKEFLHADA